ncbi:hypothetical protein RhiLY_05950 [Ceratobasidium sp. AG-Ba]|nr:hypothetical protein RhiLY_05950 [Ceratobasidium sp. AG-Ba]
MASKSIVFEEACLLSSWLFGSGILIPSEPVIRGFRIFSSPDSVGCLRYSLAPHRRLLQLLSERASYLSHQVFVSALRYSSLHVNEPISKRPPIPSLRDPAVPDPTDLAIRPKRGKKAATTTPPANIDAPTVPSEATQPKPKPKGKTAKGSDAVPAPDPDAAVEPAPPAKTTRKRTGAGANVNKVATAKPAASARWQLARIEA